MHRHELLHLSLLDEVGPATVQQLMHIGEHLSTLSKADLMHYGLSERKAQIVSAGLADKRILETELSLIEKYEITWVTVFEDRYPALLKQIYLPPAILYFKGSSLDQSPLLAVVGSRKGDSYGKAAVERILPPLIEQGYGIVSGGALGIDAFAHTRTIASQGLTYVVLGSGLLRPYPRSHVRLFKEVIESGGALISCFRLQQEALPGLFPARNRIIAGLSRGCLVIQAALASGALITAYHALHEGREVFAVPGRIDAPLSEGCHSLIAQGAVLTTSAEDILAVFQPRTISAESRGGSPKELLLNACKAPRSTGELIACMVLPAATVEQLLDELVCDGRLMRTSLGLWQTIG